MDASPRHPSLADGYRPRRPTPDDVEAVTALKQAVDVQWHGDTDVTIEHVREEWALPRLDLARDAWVIEGNGAVVGYGFCWVEAPPATMIAEQTVAPEARGRGLSEVLLDLCEARAAELLQAAAPAGDGSLGVWAHERDLPRITLYERRGYAHVRTFLRLDRDLDRPVEQPVWPAGIVVTTFRRDRDEARVHAAGEEAFRDHFRPSQMDLDEWLEYRFVRGDLDLGLWFVAWDGDDVAGAALSFETPVGGYVDELFVRRPWRGCGLGRALLLQTCVELQRRGQPIAYLGVDSENPTGAMHLYGSAGFRSTHGATLVFERKLGRS